MIKVIYQSDQCNAVKRCCVSVTLRWRSKLEILLRSLLVIQMSKNIHHQLECQIVLYLKIKNLIHWSRSCVFWNAVQDRYFVCKLCCIGCTWKASLQCASSCASADHQKSRKRSWTGYTCVTFLLNGSSSCDLSNDQLWCRKNRTLCICGAFPQSAFSCVFANYQKRRKCSCTGYTCMAFLLCAFASCEFSNCQFQYWNTHTLCICEAFPQSESFCAASVYLTELKRSRIDCIYVVSLQYVL